MIIKPKNTDYEHPDEDPDDFEEVLEHPAEEPRQPKKPTLTPDNPDYWDEEESEFEHLRPTRTRRFLIMLAIAAGATAILCFIWYRWFSPYTQGAIQYGYVEQIERRGDIFKTLEGTILPYKSITDTVAPYEGDLHFSAADDHVAAQLRRLMFANLPARVEYSVYHATLPWRGESKVVITHVDTADPRKILPPGIPHPTIPTQSRESKE